MGAIETQGTPAELQTEMPESTMYQSEPIQQPTEAPVTLATSIPVPQSAVDRTQPTQQPTEAPADASIPIPQSVYEVQQPKLAPKANQVRALARKALSYQKRQWFTNICCIALCPFFMVNWVF